MVEARMRRGERVRASTCLRRGTGIGNGGSRNDECGMMNAE